MTLYFGKAHLKMLPRKHEPGVNAKQELRCQGTAFPTNRAAMRTTQAMGLVTSLTSLGNAGKYQ